MRKYIVLAAILLTATACGDTWGQRAVTGGAVGAGYIANNNIFLNNTITNSTFNSTIIYGGGAVGAYYYANTNNFSNKQRCC